MNDSIHLEVVTPDHKVFDDRVGEVILPGEQGYLGVRPGHTPLLTSLMIGELSWVQGGKSYYAALRGGFAEVLPDRVSVLTEAAEISDAIDVARAEASRARAEQILKDIRDTREKDYEKAAARLRRAVVRISVAGKRAV
jgi:F-type H+-transporting ATPase subunit epsilon